MSEDNDESRGDELLEGVEKIDKDTLNKISIEMKRIIYQNDLLLCQLEQAEENKEILQKENKMLRDTNTRNNNKVLQKKLNSKEEEQKNRKAE